MGAGLCLGVSQGTVIVIEYQIPESGTALPSACNVGEVCTVFGTSIVTLLLSPWKLHVTVEHPAIATHRMMIKSFMEPPILSVCGEMPNYCQSPVLLEMPTKPEQGQRFSTTTNTTAGLLL